MSILQGTLTAFVATVIASGMIVFADNDVADDKAMIKISEENPLSSDQPNLIDKKLLTSKKRIDAQASKPRKITVNNFPLAPPGPFLKKGMGASAQKTLPAPLAPQAPISLLEQPKRRAKPPLLSQEGFGAKDDLSKPLAPTRPSIERLTNTVPVMPSNMSKQPTVFSTDIPIWMQKGTIAKQGFKKHSSNTVQQKQATMGVPNMGWNNNYPAQQYIYVPVPMIPSSMRPPQMPIFNKSIISPSNYWGASTPLNNTSNVELQKKPEKGLDVPMKKGSK